MRKYNRQYFTSKMYVKVFKKSSRLRMDKQNVYNFRLLYFFIFKIFTRAFIRTHLFNLVYTQLSI